MFRLSPPFAVALTAALIVATAAFANPDDKVSAIEVSIDLDAVTNKTAARRFATIADDLKNALSTQLVDRIATEGATITVDLSELELSNSYTELVGSADTRLVGDVKITDDSQSSNAKVFTLTIDVNQAKSALATDIDLTKLSASSAEYYQALIDAFAKSVIAELDM